MKNYTLNQGSHSKRYLGLVVATACVTCSFPAFAEPFSGQVGIATEYLGKGLGKSDEEPALSGTLKIETQGLYATAFASQAASSKDAEAEVILTAGYTREVKDWVFDAQVMYREMVGETGGVDSGYMEYQADVSRDLTDRLSARFRINYSTDTYGAAEAAWWSEAQATVKLTSADRLSVAYGIRRVDNGADYDAWNIGIKHKFTPALSGDLRWYDTNSHELGSRYKGRLVAALSYSF